MRSLLLLLLPFSVFSQEIVDSSIVKHKKLVYFDTNEYKLSEEDTNEILELVSLIDEVSNYSFLVDAHTDSIGTVEANLILSEKRKQSVVKLLVDNGIPDSVIDSKFHGEALPVELEQSVEGRQKNRRVVVQLKQPKTLLKLKGTIVDETTQEGIIGEVELHSKDYKLVTHSDENGNYTVWAPLDEHIVLEVNAKDYFFESKRVKVTRSMFDKIIRLPLLKAELGSIYALDNMFFVGNKAILLSKSKPVINQLWKFLMKNNELCIELAGHVNLPNEPPSLPGSFHNNLASSRALAVQEKMISRGIPSDRMLSRGYGNWKMIHPKATTENQMRKNRRVEVIVTSCDSIRLLADDVVKDDINISFKAINQFYNKETAREDTESFSERMQIDIILQVENMKKAGMDPEKYTYRTMLSALPGLPEKKK